MSWLRYLRRAFSDYATLAHLWWDELASRLAYKMRAPKHARPALWSPQGGSGSHDEAYTEFDEIVKGIDVDLGIPITTTKETHGFVNSDGLPGVVLVFRVDAAMTTAAFPLAEPSHDFINHAHMVMQVIGHQLAFALEEIVDPEHEFTIYGEKWKLSDLIEPEDTDDE